MPKTLTTAFGQASTAEEKSLEQSLIKIDAWRDKTISYERIAAGFTNFNFKLYVAEESRYYFAKVPGPNTEMFINRAVAYEAAVNAARSGYAPRVVHYVAEDNFEVHEFLDSFRSCLITDMLDADISRNIMRVYSKLHSGELLSQTKIGFEQIAEHVRQAEQLGADRPLDLDFLLWQMGRARAAIEASGIDLAPCYNDGYVTNYMIDDDKNVRIIDWEYGANNDPYWDLALYFFESYANAETRWQLLEHYVGQVSQEHEARVYLYIPLVCLKWGLWAALQASISAIAFDYLKYSDILLMRARHLMRLPAWEESLERV